jgi:hypothetical protein
MSNFQKMIKEFNRNHLFYFNGCLQLLYPIYPPIIFFIVKRFDFL